ncbi:MAG: FMN-binding protein [Nannocystaceae bacterium]
MTATDSFTARRRAALVRLAAIAALPLTLLGVCHGRSWAHVFHSRESALELAFSRADEVRPITLFLSEFELAHCSRLAGSHCSERTIRAYAGYDAEDALIGYAFIDTHPVRSLQETVMFVSSPAGRIQKSVVLAFHEPADYMATPRWLTQFKGHSLSSQLALHRGIDVMSGATITSNVLTSAARRVLAVQRIKLGQP